MKPSASLTSPEGLTALYHYQFAQQYGTIFSMAESIKEIHKALKTGESAQLLYTNALVCSIFPEIIFAQNSGIIEVSKEAMESQPLQIQSDSLKAIGILLYKSILAEKALQATQEAGKIAMKQAMKNFFGDSFGLLRP